MFFRGPARRDLLPKPQQIQVPRRMRAEAGDFDVVPDQVWISAVGVELTGEESFLVIEARSPRQATPHLEILSHAVPQHVRGVHALRRIFIVRAAGGVDVVVARPITPARRVHPAFHAVREVDG